MFHANTTAKVFRESDTDAFGDAVDVDTTPVYSGVRMSIIEQARRVFVPADNQDRVIRYTRGRAPSDITILEGDRILDERNNLKYIVEAVVNPGSAYTDGDTRLDLKRIS
jgi:hypothetical protein